MDNALRDRASVIAGIGVLLLASYAAWQSALQLLYFTQTGALSPAQTLLCVAKTLGLLAIGFADLVWLVSHLLSRGWVASPRALWFANAVMLWCAWLADRDLAVAPNLPVLAAIATLLAAVAAMTAREAST